MIASNQMQGMLTVVHLCSLTVKVIVERYLREKTLPLLDKTKFLVPFELTLGQFLCLLRWALVEGVWKKICIMIKSK